ncbi:MAG TPA: alpha-amylase family glycosyl hydrolase [Candidatus Lokiarchaeia archaeon]|nr:alpha-amylase family glycosyl hydrolase [Candidatus Lokiarchaeia archaeon]
MSEDLNASATQSTQEGPRIYNLFPRLVGPIDKWMEHVTRAKDMGFSWIYVNPLNYPGFSGSLYATKDFYKFNPAFAPSDATADAREGWDPFRQFVEDCHSIGVQVILDLVINHTSIDAMLVEEHPDWYLHKWAAISKADNRPVYFFAGEKDPRDTSQAKQWPSRSFRIEWRVANPSAIDPADARKVTVWGDLAEIDNEYSADRNNLWQFWQDLLGFYLSLGVDGFRCDAAYQVPADLWQTLISFAKRTNAAVIFLAETLGCTLKQLQALQSAGFDFIFSSSKFWDFTQPWALEQYNSFRVFAPSVSFPETHDTTRLAAETGGRQDVQEFKYFFAAIFSAGVMMPVGYEYGFQGKLDVVTTDPTDWEEPTFDITSELAVINTFKKSLRTLNEDGAMVQFPYGDTNILVLRKTSLDEGQHFLLIYNKNWSEPHRGYLADLTYFLPLGTPIYCLTVDGNRELVPDNSWDAMIAPNDYVLFLQECDE